MVATSVKYSINSADHRDDALRHLPQAWFRSLQRLLCFTSLLNLLEHRNEFLSEMHIRKVQFDAFEFVANSPMRSHQVAVVDEARKRGGAASCNAGLG